MMWADWPGDIVGSTPKRFDDDDRWPRRAWESRDGATVAQVMVQVKRLTQMYLYYTRTHTHTPAGLPRGWGFPWVFPGYGYGTVINSHGIIGILWGFLNRSEIQWKRFKYGVNVTADIWISPNSPMYNSENDSVTFANILTKFGTNKWGYYVPTPLKKGLN